MTRSPNYGKIRMTERLPEDSATRPWSTVELARQWHLRIAPGTRVIVTTVTLETQTVSHWRVEGISALDSEHVVAGGPQMAATASREAVREWSAQISGGRAA